MQTQLRTFEAKTIDPELLPPEEEVEAISSSWEQYRIPGVNPIFYLKDEGEQ